MEEDLCMGKRKDYEAVLKVLSEKSRKSDEFWVVLKRKLPHNTDWRVSENALGWINIAEANGWKLQQNTILKNARIIDNKSVRRAFSLISSELFGVMDELVRELQEQDESTKSSSSNDSMVNELAKLEYLAQLRDKGAITDEEYEEKKKEILKRI